MATWNFRSKKRKTVSPNSQPEKIVYSYGIDIISGTMNMEDSVATVEAMLGYIFKDKSLLEAALTHSSYTDTQSYQRLEFIGDAAIGLAVSNFFYLTYPDVDPAQLSLLRAANISTEKLARVAVKHGLYKYVRHKATTLNHKVREFIRSVEEEEETAVHGGRMKAPKVLADIVESVAAAVYVDCGMNLPMMWTVIRELLEPIVMLNLLEKQPQPVTTLFETCQKHGKQLDIRHWRKGERNIASVYVDGRFVASGSSENKDNAKLHAAEVALSKITRSKSNDDATCANLNVKIYKTIEIEGAKQKVHELCNKKRWLKPVYRVEQELGAAHDKRYISSVEIEEILCVKGEERSRVKDAENSAASMMFYALQQSGHI